MIIKWDISKTQSQDQMATDHPTSTDQSPLIKPIMPADIPFFLSIIIMILLILSFVNSDQQEQINSRKELNTINCIDFLSANENLEIINIKSIQDRNSTLKHINKQYKKLCLNHHNPPLP